MFWYRQRDDCKMHGDDGGRSEGALIEPSTDCHDVDRIALNIILFFSRYWWGLGEIGCWRGIHEQKLNPTTYPFRTRAVVFRLHPVKQIILPLGNPDRNKGDKTEFSDMPLVCANCHRMIHSKSPDCYLVEELKQVIKNNLQKD